jgi:hypothetical protein
MEGCVRVIVLYLTQNVRKQGLSEPHPIEATDNGNPRRQQHIRCAPIVLIIGSLIRLGEICNYFPLYMSDVLQGILSTIYEEHIPGDEADTGLNRTPAAPHCKRTGLSGASHRTCPRFECHRYRSHQR